MTQAVTERKRGAKPRWQRRKDARPAELVAAALEVFVVKAVTGEKGTLKDSLTVWGKRDTSRPCCAA